MDINKEKEFYHIFEKMVSAMTDPHYFDRRTLLNAIKEMSLLFGVGKAYTEFYTSRGAEREGKGDILVGFDGGNPGEVIIDIRVDTETGAVVKGRVYAEEGVTIGEEERGKLSLATNCVLSFLARTRLQRAIEKMGFYDEQNYPNLRSFMRYIGQRIDMKTINNYAAIHFNIRQLTLINREIGRDNGDIAMRGYFKMFENEIGEDGIVCHVGGDNFVSVFEKEHLEKVILILNGKSVIYDKEKGKEVKMSANAGVFVIPEDCVMERPGQIMERIISASNVAKLGGKESIVFYDNKMIELKDKTMRIQREFPDAMSNEEFKVFYQPKVDVKSGRIVGAEALCRWFKDGKMVPPGDFIPILEQSNDICKLDFYMLDHVCRDLCRWIKEGRKVVRVSVNFSRKHLRDEYLLEHIMEIIEKNEAPHEYVEIELTETTTDVEFRDLKKVVNGLQMEGVYTSVDDFGMGYSSLNLIREIPWNVLKIDRCFLPTEEDGEESVTNIMFKHVVAMAKDLGLECVTEGVETHDQLDILKENNCDVAQGFYFDRPLPVEEFEERLARVGYNI
ncbi:MAG: GGDEF domain-containing protein [Lachnospiraceae bacterium]|nr:GGDEF domain-containing protein [Lachnospiraceae bacterium]